MSTGTWSNGALTKRGAYALYDTVDSGINTILDPIWTQLGGDSQSHREPVTSEYNADGTLLQKFGSLKINRGFCGTAAPYLIGDETDPRDSSVGDDNTEDGNGDVLIYARDVRLCAADGAVRTHLGGHGPYVFQLTNVQMKSIGNGINSIPAFGLTEVVELIPTTGSALALGAQFSHDIAVSLLVYLELATMDLLESHPEVTAATLGGRLQALKGVVFPQADWEDVDAISAWTEEMRNGINGRYAMTQADKDAIQTKIWHISERGYRDPDL